MSSVASPFGLKPAFSLSGIVRSAQGTLASGLASDIFQNSPVAINAAGFIVPAASGLAGNIVGQFEGVEYTATDGRRRVENKWSANTVGTDIVVYYSQDPWMVYEIQADAPIEQTNIGNLADYTALAGNATTGLSSVALAVSTAGTTAARLRIIGVNPAPDNVIGDAFTIAQVLIAEHQFVETTAAVQGI